MAAGAAGGVSALNRSQLDFAASLSKITGLNQYVIEAWELAEEPASRSPSAQGYNWLNIGPGKTYASDAAAVQATAQFLQGSYYTGIRAAAKSGTPAQQLAAIAASPWDAGHYGSSAGNPLGNLAGTYQIVSSKKVTGDVITSGIGAVLGAPGKAVGAVSSGVSSVGDALGKLTDPSVWLSAGFVLAGLVLVVMGALRLFTGSTPNPAKLVALPAKAAELGAVAA